MSAKVGTVTLADGRLAFEIWASKAGVEITTHVPAVSTISPLQARAMGALLNVAGEEVTRMREESSAIEHWRKGAGPENA